MEVKTSSNSIFVI